MGGSGESKFRKQDSGQREDIPSKETNTFYQKENKVTKKDKKSECEVYNTAPIPAGIIGMRE